MEHDKNILKLSLNSDKTSFMYSLVYFIQFVVPDNDNLHISRIVVR